MFSPSFYSKIMPFNKFTIPFLLLVTLGSLPLSEMAHGQAAPQWWMSNSLKTGEQQQGFRYHAEGEYSTYHSTGQVKAYIHKTAPYFFVRNGRYQLSAFGTMTYQKLQVMSQPGTRTRSFSANPKLIFDANKTMQLEGGVLLERDDAQYLHLRSAVYGGVSVNHLDHPKLGKLLFVALGNEYVTTTELPDGLGVEKLNNPILYAQQRFILKTIPKVNLSQTLIYIHGIENDGIYRLDLDLKAMYQLNAHISGMVQYQIKYQEEPLIPDLAPYYSKQNTALTIGTRFNF